MSKKEINQKDAPSSELTHQAQSRHNTQVAQVEAIHDVRLVSFNTAKRIFQPDNREIEGNKENARARMDSFD